jgi:choline dehydrogenase-like flavoprotein
MFLDLRRADDKAAFAADICVIGAGAAGIAMANAINGSKTKVVLVESGDLDLEAETQALYAGRNLGQPYFDLEDCRLRYFGGSTNHWGGWCGVLEDVDFEERSWVPLSGWPINRRDLDPYYQRALKVCKLGPLLFDERAFKAIGAEPLDVDRRKLSHVFWQTSWESLGTAVNFGEAYREDLQKSNNVQVLLNANVVNLQTNSAASVVEQADLRALNGRSASVRARVFVLACGGIENARILLYSNKVEPNGLGNRHDLVGRYFMEHPNIPWGTMTGDNLQDLVSRYGLRAGPEGKWFMAAFGLAKELQQREQILNAGSSFEFNYVQFSNRADTGIVAAQRIWHDIKQGHIPDELGAKLWRIARDLDEVALTAYRRFVEQQPVVPPLSEVYLFSRSEQAPNWDSRVLLSAEKDALGLPRADLDWRLSDIDKHTVAVMAKTIGAELSRTNVARVHIDEWVLDGTSSWHGELHGGWHHMGTTRMADQASRGVVDRHCRVHGVDNLYVAGSSVFPTSGWMNPTLTIVALALRLSDHLGQRLA